MSIPDNLAVRLLRPDVAAAYLAISTRQLRSLTNSGQIPYVDVGRGLEREARRYERADLDTFIERNKTTAAPVSVSRLPTTFLSLPIIDFQATRDELRAKRKAEKGAKRLRR